jgi:hypothetical protein
MEVVPLLPVQRRSPLLLLSQMLMEEMRELMTEMGQQTYEHSPQGPTIEEFYEI